MYDAVERLGRGGAGTVVSGLQGLTKELVLALVNVRPEAPCRTCCLAGIIESSNFVRKSMPRIGVATAASKKSNSKLWPAKQTVWRRRPQAGIGLPRGADLWAAPSLNAAGSTKNLGNFANHEGILGFL